jgi:hypothetical protein
MKPKIELKSACFSFEDEIGNKYDVDCSTVKLGETIYSILENGVKKRDMVFKSGHINKSLVKSMLVKHFELEERGE